MQKKNLNKNDKREWNENMDLKKSGSFNPTTLSYNGKQYLF